MSVRVHPPPLSSSRPSKRRLSSASGQARVSSQETTPVSGVPIAVPMPGSPSPDSSFGSPLMTTSINGSLALGPQSIVGGAGTVNGNQRPKVSRSATTTYGKPSDPSGTGAGSGMLTVVTEDEGGIVLGVGVGSGVETRLGLTRTRSRSRGISITSSQTPLIHLPDRTILSELERSEDHSNPNARDMHAQITVAADAIPATSAGYSNTYPYRNWNTRSNTLQSGSLSPIPQSPFVPEEAGPGSPSETGSTFSTNTYPPPSPINVHPPSASPNSVGLGPPPTSTYTPGSSSGSKASSSNATLTPQDRRRGLTRRISSPTMRGSAPIFPVPAFHHGVGQDSMGDRSGSSGGAPNGGSERGSNPPGGQGVYQNGGGSNRVPSRLQFGYVPEGRYPEIEVEDTGRASSGDGHAGNPGATSHTGPNGNYPSQSNSSGSGSGPSSNPYLTTPSGSGSGSTLYEPYQVRPRSTSVNGFSDANFGSPTAAAAAGGILGGFWLAGTALLGSIIGGAEVRAGEDEVRRTPSAKSIGKKRSQGSDSESEKGYITPPLGARGDTDDGFDAGLGNGKGRQGGYGWMNGVRDEGYFALTPLDSLGESARGLGSTLPTPTLSSASLSGRRPEANGAGYSASPSKQRRRRATTVGTQQPFSSLRTFFYDIGAGLSGTSPARYKHSPLPSPLPTPSALVPTIPPEFGSEKRQVRTRGNSTAAKRPEGLPQVSYQSTRMRVEEPETVPLVEALRETIRDMGWTLGFMGLAFVLSLGVVAALLRSLPIHSLKSLPKKVSDIQILSAEIKSYMASGSRGWWHVILTLIITGCWKHSWSIPGAVILNILVGSLMKPIPAVMLLTLITSIGSLGSYTLSRPLAPLIGLVFPKPLALVRTAIGGSKGEQVGAFYDTTSEQRPTVWRRLLVMRAMGVVPWSGMNVACGVVGVNWMTFLLTTAGGSASWSYVTANVGDILSQLAIPKDAIVEGSEHPNSGAGTGTDPISGGQSLSGLLRDPALIAKLIVLSLLSLLPIFFKSRSDPTMAPPPQLAQHGGLNISLEDQASTPLAPTPSVYYLAASVRHLVKGAIRGSETVWRKAWVAMSGRGFDDPEVDRATTSR